jgi:hypothetical protein
VGWGCAEKQGKLCWHPRAGLRPSCLVHSNVRDMALITFVAPIVATPSAANVALKDLSQGQKLSTEFIDMTVRSHWVLLMLAMLTHHLVLCRCSSLSLIWHPELLV